MHETACACAVVRVRACVCVRACCRVVTYVDDVLGRHELAAAQLLGVLKHQLGPLGQVALLHGRERAPRGIELVEQHQVVLRVLAVRKQVRVSSFNYLVIYLLVNINRV
jgi:hypothetical protein